MGSESRQYVYKDFILRLRQAFHLYALKNAYWIFSYPHTKNKDLLMQKRSNVCLFLQKHLEFYCMIQWYDPDFPGAHELGKLGKKTWVTRKQSKCYHKSDSG